MLRYACWYDICSLSVQVLRYSALVAGLIYGLYHQSSLNTQAKHAEIDREYKRKESLIEQAKTEWKKKTMPPETKSGSTGSTFPPWSRVNSEWPMKPAFWFVACSHYRSRGQPVWSRSILEVESRRDREIEASKWWHYGKLYCGGFTPSRRGEASR